MQTDRRSTGLFDIGLDSYGPAHHCAVGIGNIGSKIKKFGTLLGIEVVQIC